MPRNLHTVVGESGADNLVGDNMVYQKCIEVLLPAGGDFKRGQLLVLGADNKTASMPTAETDSVNCILLTDVGETTEVTSAAAALTGEFNENAVLWGTITEEGKPKVVRNSAANQLYIAPMHKAPFVQFGEVE